MQESAIVRLLRLAESRREWHSFSTSGRCYVYEDFVKGCMILKHLRGLKMPTLFFVNCLSQSLWSMYPEVVELLTTYTEIADDENTFVSTSYGQLVNISKVSLASFCDNFLEVLSVLKVDYSLHAEKHRRRVNAKKARRHKARQRNIIGDASGIDFIDIDDLVNKLADKLNITRE